LRYPEPQNRRPSDSEPRLPPGRSTFHEEPQLEGDRVRVGLRFILRTTFPGEIAVRTVTRQAPGNGLRTSDLAKPSAQTWHSHHGLSALRATGRFEQFIDEFLEA
jgi:hypothetical protein